MSEELKDAIEFVDRCKWPAPRLDREYFELVCEAAKRTAELAKHEWQPIEALPLDRSYDSVWMHNKKTGSILVTPVDSRYEDYSYADFWMPVLIPQPPKGDE